MARRGVYDGCGLCGCDSGFCTDLAIGPQALVSSSPITAACARQVDHTLIGVLAGVPDPRIPGRVASGVRGAGGA